MDYSIKWHGECSEVMVVEGHCFECDVYTLMAHETYPWTVNPNGKAQ